MINNAFKQVACLTVLPLLYACNPSPPASPSVDIAIADLDIADSSGNTATSSSSYTLPPAEEWVTLTSKDFNISSKTSWSMEFNYEVNGPSHGTFTLDLWSNIGNDLSNLDVSLTHVGFLGFIGVAEGSMVTLSNDLSFGFDFGNFDSTAPGTYWIWLDYTPAQTAEDNAALLVYHANSNTKPENATLTIDLDWSVSTDVLPNRVERSEKGKTHFQLRYANPDNETSFTINSDFNFVASPAANFE